MADLGDWFRSLPVFTRYWFGLSIFFPLLGRFGLIDPRHLILETNRFFYSFQLWRPVTALFYYPLTPGTGFHYLLNLYFLYTYSIRLESGIFHIRPADYLFLLLFNWICIVIVGFLADIWLLMDPMVLSVLYIWCQLNKDMIVSFWFGSQFKAMYLPWVILAFNVILSRGSGLYELTGILVGHLYFFLMFKYPQEFGGHTLLKTPSILYTYFPNRVGGFGGFGQAPTRRQPENNQGDGRRHIWGRGHTLGGD